MATARLGRIIQHLRCVLEKATDDELLERFLASRDEAAFETLVWRHGPMVFGVCRRVLGSVHDAEDAFQATFLVLARKGASVRKRALVCNWLYGVANRTARHAKRAAIRRRAKEASVIPRQKAADDWDGLREVLDLEMERLPDKYRAPLLLCDFEGKTRREAARQLGLPDGTVASQLATARRMLARRLSRHGLAFSGGVLASVLAEGRTLAGLPAQLVCSTVQAAALVAAGKAAATPAAILMNEVLQAMLLTKLKFTATGILAVMMLGASGLIYRAAGQTEGQPTSRPRTEVESLRREIELLKFNLEVVLEKCRAQDAQLHALKRNTAVVTSATVRDFTGVVEASATQILTPRFSTTAGTETRSYVADPNSLQARVGVVKTSAEAEMEHALKAFRDATGNEAKARAAQKLEDALKKLRQQLKPAANDPLLGK